MATPQVSKQDLMSHVLRIGNKLDDKQFGPFKVAATQVLEIDQSRVQEDTTFAEVYGMIKEKVNDEAPSIVYQILKKLKFSKRILNGALKAAATAAPVDIDKKYPNLDKVLKFGIMVMSMENNDYNRFTSFFTDGSDENHRILSDYSPDRIESRCQIVQLLIEQKKYLTDDDEKNVCEWLAKSDNSKYWSCFIKMQFDKPGKMICTTISI